VFRAVDWLRQGLHDVPKLEPALLPLGQRIPQCTTIVLVGCAVDDAMSDEGNEYSKSVGKMQLHRHV